MIPYTWLITYTLTQTYVYIFVLLVYMYICVGAYAHTHIFTNMSTCNYLYKCTHTISFCQFSKVIMTSTFWSGQHQMLYNARVSLEKVRVLGSVITWELWMLGTSCFYWCMTSITILACYICSLLTEVCSDLHCLRLFYTHATAWGR